MQPYCHVLDFTGLVSKEEQNIQSHHSVRRGFMNFSSLWINKLSIFDKVTSILHFKPMCCISIIPGIFLFQGLVIILSHSQTFFTHLLWHHIFDNRYIIFSIKGWFYLFWVSHISGWKISTYDPAWMTCNLSISGFVIFLHSLIVYQTWLLVNKHTSRMNS